MYRKVIEFQKITKFPLIEFLEQYSFFNENYLEDVRKYFSAQTESIGSEKLIMLNEISLKCSNLLSVINNFNNKFTDCGFWELIDYIESLTDNIEKIKKWPKYYKVTKTDSGYKDVVEMNGSVGSMRTFEDIENELNYDNFDKRNNWLNLMKNNDIEETDWEIDEIKPIKYTISKSSISVNTIVDVLIGDNIYGRDICKKITFDNNDLLLVKYLDNIKQKSEILLNLKKGDVPEIVNFGVDNKFLGNTVKSFVYQEIFTQIENNFMQNDIFDSIEVNNFNFNGDSLTIEINIKTKYNYSLSKQIEL